MTGYELRDALKKAGITQAKFAALVGYHPVSIGNICAFHDRAIPARAAEKFAKALAKLAKQAA